jgi:ACR3 family arsenite transporter
MSFNMLLIAVAMFIVVPLVVGVFLRTVLIRGRGNQGLEKSLLPRFQPVAVMALLAPLVLIFAFQADNIVNRPLHVALIAAPILIQLSFNSSLTYGLMWLL